MNSISRRSFLAAAGAGVLTSCATTGISSARSERPNILFILTDDQRWDTMGCVGNPVIQTPNLDQLARQGILFRNAFVTTPICAVSRASFLTGMYARTHGINDFGKNFTDEQMANLYPVVLRNNGYSTGFMGKWGVSAISDERMDEFAQLFDFWAGAAHQSNFWHERDCPYATANGFTDRTGNHCTCPPKGSNVRVGHEGMKDPIHQETEIFPHKVEEFLSGRDRSKPFCLSVSFKSAHSPTSDFPATTADLYTDAAMPFPETATAELAHELPAFLQASLNSDHGAEVAADHEKLAEDMRHYYRLLTGMDAAIGDMRKSLAKHGVADNTIILFTSDHGFFLGDRGLFGKWLGYEASLRVPCIVYDPRVSKDQRGTRRDEMVLNIDFAPTMLDLAGVAVPASMQGRSIVPLLENEPTDWRDIWYFDHVYTHGGKIVPSEGVRTTRWKYIRYFAQDPVVEEIFDLQSDPNELHNLAPDPTHAAILNELRRQCDQFREDLAP